MIIELHLLQSFPVSNLNRDDVGQPKTATFGGHVRGRISSQSLKRAARVLFQKDDLRRYGLDPAEIGIRTKRLVSSAAGVLKGNGRPEAEVGAVAEAGIRALGFGLDERRKEQRLTQYLLFVGSRAAELLADYCERDWDRLAADAAARAKPAGRKKTDGDDGPGKKQTKVRPDKQTLDEARRIFDASRVIDVALFGRMIADNKDFNVDAACQVAHAISTHAVANEYDYYTAVDDLQPQDQAGADMIGTVDFNAACYYRYANLNIGQLATNLKGDTDLVSRATQAWLHAFIDAIPNGKQNSMAALTPPETLLAVVRDRGTWNLANAFLRPVDEADLMDASTREMFGHFGRLRRFYGDADLRTVAAASITADVDGLPEQEVVTTRHELVSRVLAATKA
ncbi:type I-E CRISPR-associated protein Cas7/Cse4/CasC [Dactylosporangium sp. NPDC000555]|uniref:type I-E CRISPR-associated protein Cas7/Cse4/CasC n=1 Tax=Dactylosporangium sp. NPDC000555 TaxID=3154260 RepID=UPI0033282D3A